MPLKPCQWFCLVKSSVGVTLGLAAFVTFSFGYSNYEAGIWAFSAAVIASICLHLHYMECRGLLSEWHSKETLRGIEHLGFVVSVISAAYFIWYLFYGFYHHIGLYPVETNPYVKAVWSYLTTSFGVMLVITCSKFSQSVDSAPLLSSSA